MFIIKILLLILLTVVFMLVCIAMFTLAERKLLSAIQRRKGPNVVGFLGLLQPIADGFKLLVKEIILPTKANTVLFIVGPMLSLFLSLIGWIIIPFSINTSVVNINLGVLFILAISSLNIYGLILSGWASNSKYALLGSLRSVAQMISYEITISLSVLPVIICSGSLNLNEIVLKQQGVFFIFLLWPAFLVFFISVLAETNRAPFDLPEAEAEIVAGYNIEYSSIIFAMFFLGEYCNMLLMSAFASILYFGGWLSPFFFSFVFLQELFFALKIVFFCFLFILVRGILPRYRYDQLMILGWKKLFPFIFGFTLFITGLLVAFDGLPYITQVPGIFKYSRYFLFCTC